MKSSFEELLRDLQIISKELFLSSWNLVSTTNLNTALLYMCGYFTSTTWWKYSLFIQFPRCRNPSLRHFLGYSFRASRKKVSTIFYSTAKNKASTVSYRTAKDKSGRPCQRAWLFHLHSMVRTYRFFFSCSVYGLYGWGILLVIPLELQGKKHRPFFMAQPKIKHQPFPIVQSRIKAEGPVRGRGCFISTVWWEHTVFSSVVPFMGFMAEAFYWSFF